MPKVNKKSNFSKANKSQIEDLTYNSTMKHSLENRRGVHISTIKHILGQTKMVDMVKFEEVIVERLHKAVQEKNLYVTDDWFKLPRHEELYQRRLENLKNKRKWNWGLNLIPAEALPGGSGMQRPPVDGGKAAKKRKLNARDASKLADKPLNKKKQRKRNVVKNSNVEAHKNQMGTSKKHSNQLMHKGKYLKKKGN